MCKRTRYSVIHTCARARGPRARDPRRAPATDGPVRARRGASKGFARRHLRAFVVLHAQADV